MSQQVIAHTAEVDAARRARSTILRFWIRTIATRREGPIFAVSALTFFYFVITTNNFATIDSLHTLLTFVAPVAVVAIGLTPLIVSGEIDVSGGQAFAFAPVLLYEVYQRGAPLLVAAVVAVAATAGVGMINGLIATYFHLTSFVVTLGMYFVLAGLNVSILNAPATTPGSGTYLDITAGPYSEIIWALVIVVIAQVVLSKTRFGLRTVAVGANIAGAIELGVPVRRIKIANFMFASAMAGLAGVFESVRVATTDPGAGGSTLAFQSIAAVVIGGTLLAGGSGTAVGSLLGAVFLGIINEGFALAGISAYTFNLIVGIAILVALIINRGLIVLSGAGATR
jgi:simple sugar transport system permease protein